MNKRILIKLSGEGLSNFKKGLLIDPQVVSAIAKQIKVLVVKKFQIAIVVGGGNFWRGSAAEKNGIPRVRADYIGMLATVMNGLALQSAFEQENIPTEVQSAIKVDEKVARGYVVEKAISFLEKGKVVIFAGGTGRPYFTTDTTAALVASEIKAQRIFMGKNKVDGVYDSDPKKNNEAKKFKEITYDELLLKGLCVIDSTAATMARDNKITLIIFDITNANALVKVVQGILPHTIVRK